MKQQMTIQIVGMTCADCVREVQAALKGQPGVAAAQVYWPSGFADVWYDPANVTEEQIMANEVFRWRFQPHRVTVNWWRLMARRGKALRSPVSWTEMT